MSISDDLTNIEKKIENITEEHHSLAYEMILDCKKNTFFIISLLIIVLFLSNMAWLWYFSQYDFNSEETTIDGGNGTATYLENSESGDINYGENKN